MRTPLISTVLLLALAGCVADETPAPADGGAKAASQPSKPAAKTPASPTSKPTPKALEVGHVDAAGAAKLLADEPGVVVLDVRTAGEFADGHIKDAVNIDFRGDDFASKLGALDKTKKYLVHCKSGGRSTNSLPKFKELGFQHVVHLDGGMMAWSSASQPVVK